MRDGCFLRSSVSGARIGSPSTLSLASCKRASFSLSTKTATAQRAITTMAVDSGFYDLKAKDIDGNEVDFKDRFGGKVVLITNVASACGYTDGNYKGTLACWRTCCVI